MAYRGGRKGGLQKFIRDVKRAKARSSTVDVGFMATARYPDGTPVAAVAAWNEFGTERQGQPHVPERPFFRNAIRAGAPKVVDVVKENLDPKTLVFDRRVAGKVGQVLVGEIRREITNLRVPENAPATVTRKGSSNPLIDTGQMRSSATYRVD